MHEFWDLFQEALRKVGKNPDVSEQIEDIVKQHGGFTEVRHITMKIPWGTWPRDRRNKDMGRLASKWHLKVVEIRD